MLTVNNTHIDLNKLTLGKTYGFSYILENTSTSPILIKKIVRGCGSCTEAECKSPNVEPGKKTLIDVKFTPGSTGINKKTLQVIYTGEDGVEQNLNLTFGGSVI